MNRDSRERSAKYRGHDDDNINNDDDRRHIRRERDEPRRKDWRSEAEVLDDDIKLDSLSSDTDESQ